MGQGTWSTDNDRQLRALYEQLAPDGRLGEIAALMGRTQSSIRHRASRLGIGNPTHPRPRGERSGNWRGGRRAADLRVLAREGAERRAAGVKQVRPWSSEEDDYLASVSETMSRMQIAKTMDRTSRAVGSRIYRLGLKGVGKGWQPRGVDHPNWKGGKAASERRTKYKIEPNEFADLLASQSGGCAICGNDGSEHKRGLNLDHDHTTGAVRGILCGPCNVILGYAREDVIRLARAIEYLNRNLATLS